MRRTILSSVLIIGAALAVVFGGGTFSAFTDEEQISGTATAAIVDFELSGDGDTTGTDENTPSPDETLTITFDNISNLCPSGGFFAPGDSCTILVLLTRATILQQLAVDLTITVFTVGGLGDVGGGGTGDAVAGDQMIDNNCDGGAGNGPDWHVSWAWSDTGGGDNDFMPAATADLTQGINITVSLDAQATGNAGSGCQGTSPGTIALTIHAEQDATNPHTTTDTSPD